MIWLLSKGALEARDGNAELRIVALPLHRCQAAGLERAAVLLVVVVPRAHLRINPDIRALPTQTGCVPPAAPRRDPLCMPALSRYVRLQQPRESAQGLRMLGLLLQQHRSG